MKNKIAFLPLYVATLVITLFFVSSCGESDEVKDIAKAQKCLDAVPQTAYQTADDCFAHVDKHTSQQANILKCSIKLTGGGLTTAKIIQAYKATSDESNVSNSNAVYVGFLALENPTTTGVARAKEAYGFCQKSEVSGLLFIAGLVKTGTILANINGGTFDLSDPEQTAADISAILDNCADGMNAAQCDLTEIGNTISDLSEVYCADASSDQEVCTKINDSIAASAGNPEEAAKKFLCELKEGTYAGGTCT